MTQTNNISGRIHPGLTTFQKMLLHTGTEVQQMPHRTGGTAYGTD